MRPRAALQWIVDTYALVFGGLVLVAGSLADRFGRKRTFLIGVLGFAAGSAWAAFSGSVGMLIAARVAHGHRCRAHDAVNTLHHHRCVS